MVKNRAVIYIFGSISVFIISIILTGLGLIATGKIDINQREITVISGTAEKEYDGLSLTKETYKITSGNLKNGHEIEVTYLGSQVTIGSSFNEFDVKIKDDNGRDVTDDYKVNKEYGTLNVKKRKIIVESSSKDKVYDGEPLTANEWKIISGSLLDNHKIAVEITGSITDAGQVDNKINFVKITEGTVDVTKNYDISRVSGRLTVQKRVLNIKTNSETKEYDEGILAGKEYSLTGTTAAGERIVFDFLTLIQNAGKIENIGIARVLDEEDNDKTSNYSISYQYGLLTVNPKALYITIKNNVKEYDGKPIDNLEYEIINGGILPTHSLQIINHDISGEVGEINNFIEAKITNQANENVTSNYDIHISNNKMVINRPTIMIVSRSLTREYNNLPIACDEYEIVQGKNIIEANDHHIEAYFANIGLTDVGEINNAITIEIFDSDNKNVTRNYDIRYTYGKFKVLPYVVVITSGSDDKVYDGFPLSCDTYTKDRDVLQNHSLAVTFSKTLTEVGETSNDIFAEVYDEYGINITRNYEIKTQAGTLTVVANQLEGGIGIIDGDGQKNPNIPILNVTSDVTQTVYLRGESSGNYLGRGMGAASPFLGAPANPILLPSFALKLLNTPTHNIEIEHLYKGLKHYTPYFVDSIDPNEISDIYIDGPTTTYSYNFMNYDYFTNGILVPDNALYRMLEEIYRSHVYKNYLALPESTKSVVLKVANDNLLSSSSSIEEIAKFIREVATYDINYNFPSTVTDIVVDFLTVSKKGVCRHYAMAATAMYRALGLPARYVTGVKAETKAGTTVTIKSGNLHAWVEVYIDGMGWIPIEVTGESSGGGSGDEDPSILTFCPSTVYKLYDGSPLYPNDNGVTLLSGTLDLEKYTVVATISGSQTEPGIGTSTITSLNIYDSSGVNVTSNYEIKLKEGRIRVYLYEIEITSYTATKEYDSNPFALNDGYWMVTKGEIKEEIGHRLTVNLTNTRCEVGTYQNSFDYKITDAEGNDISYLYMVSKNIGDLIITPKQIKIKLEDKTKKYDGDPLVCDSWIYVDGTSVLEGHELELEIVGSQTTIGRSNSSIKSFKVFDENGKDVTDNYSIAYEKGILFVRG